MLVVSSLGNAMMLVGISFLLFTIWEAWPVRDVFTAVGTESDGVVVNL